MQFKFPKIETTSRVSALVGAALFALVGCAEQVPQTARSSTDVVLIIVDTLRADAILDPLDLVATPHIDALAADGISFSKALSNTPITLPSHTSLFSSRLPLETGVLNNGQYVPEDLPLLAEWMRNHGYQTRAVISIGALLDPSTDKGLARGFEDYDQEIFLLEDAPQVATRIAKSLAQRDPDRPLFLFAHFCDPHGPYESHGAAEVEARITLDGTPIARLNTSESGILPVTRDLDEGRHSLQFDSESPFQVRYLAVHRKGTRLDFEWETGALRKNGLSARVTFDVPEGESGAWGIDLMATDAVPVREIGPRYRSEVEYVDEYVGHVLAGLKDAGLYDDSLIIFASDHGEAIGEFGQVGHIELLTDAMIAVPLIIKPPLGHAATAQLRQRARNLTSLIDVAPTVLDLIQLPSLPGQRGMSLLRGGREVHIAETHRPQANTDRICLRDEQFKMVYVVDDDEYLMYDLARDPYERKNVFDAFSDRRPHWIDQLPELAAAARTPGESLEFADDDQLEENLKALGY